MTTISEASQVRNDAKAIYETRLYQAEAKALELMVSNVQRLVESDSFYTNNTIPSGSDTPLGMFPYGSRWKSFGDRTSRYERENGRFWPHYIDEYDIEVNRKSIRQVSALSAVGIAPVELLSAYVLKTGYKFEATAVIESEKEAVAEIVTMVNNALEKLLEVINWNNGMDREVHSAWRTEEAFTAIYPQDGDWPRVRVISPEEVTEPLNGRDISNYLIRDGQLPEGEHFWDFGILSQYEDTIKCNDTERPLGYHCVFNDSGDNWDFIPTARMVHWRRNVPARAKRGVSDYATLIQDIQQEATTNRNVAIGVGVLAAITSVVEHTDGSQLPGPDTNSGLGILQRWNQATGGSATTQEITTQRIGPGTRLNLKNKKFVTPPITQFSSSTIMETLTYLLKRIGMRWQIPGFMLLGDTESALYNSVLAIGSPFVSARMQEQEEFGKKSVELLWKLLRVAYRSGVFGRGYAWEDIRRLVKIGYQPPTVALEDETKVAERRSKELDDGIITLETARDQAGYDNDEEVRRGAPTGAKQKAPTIAAGMTPGMQQSQQPTQGQSQNPAQNPLPVRQESISEILGEWRVKLRENFDPSQPRADDGKWTDGGVAVKGSSSTPTEAKSHFQNTGEIPDGWVGHGRNGRTDLNTGYVIQASHSTDVMSQYAGNNGSKWLIKPSELSVVIDVNDEDFVDKVAHDMIVDFDKGTLPIELEGIVSDVLHHNRGNKEATIDKLKVGVNPRNIVDSAGWWDNNAFNGWFYDRYGADYIKTNDGAVILNVENVDKIRVESLKASLKDLIAKGHIVLHECFRSCNEITHHIFTEGQHAARKP